LLDIGTDHSQTLRKIGRGDAIAWYALMVKSLKMLQLAGL
jgi:hypothetical protein